MITTFKTIDKNYIIKLSAILAELYDISKAKNIDLQIYEELQYTIKALNNALLRAVQTEVI